MLASRIALGLALLVAVPIGLASGQTSFGRRGTPHVDRSSPFHLWHVDDDGGPGVDFTDIPTAISAAGPGDVILVAAGDYSCFVIGAKSLTVRAEAGATVTVSEGVAQAAISVLNLAAHQSVTLRGLTLDTVDRRGFRLFKCAGSVWIEDCEVVRTDVTYDYEEAQGLYADRCDAVILIRSTFMGAEGSDGGYSFGGGSDDGMDLVNSEVHAFGCTFLGSDASSDGACMNARRGGCGAFLTTSSFLVASGCVFEAGDGGVCFRSLGVVDAGDGGDALWLKDGCEAWLLDHELYPGAGRSPGGVDGQALVEEGTATSTVFPVTYLSAASNSIVIAGDDIVVDFAGPASVPVFLSVSEVIDPIADALSMGTSLLGLPGVVHAMGTTSPAGILQGSVATPPPLGAPGYLTLFTQAHYLHPSWGPVLGEGCSVLLLDS